MRRAAIEARGACAKIPCFEGSQSVKAHKHRGLYKQLVVLEVQVKCLKTWEGQNRKVIPDTMEYLVSLLGDMGAIKEQMFQEKLLRPTVVEGQNQVRDDSAA